LQSLELDGKIDLNKIENIYIYVDEHVTATDGRYELREAIEQEFKHGTLMNHGIIFMSLLRQM